MINNSTYGSGYASRRSDIVTTASVVNSAASSRASSGRISGPTMREGSGWSTPSKASTSFYSANTHFNDPSVQTPLTTGTFDAKTFKEGHWQWKLPEDEDIKSMSSRPNSSYEKTPSMRSAVSNSSLERARAELEALPFINKGEGSTSAPFLQDTDGKTPSMRSEVSMARSHNAEEEKELEELRARLEALRSFSPGSKSARSNASYASKRSTSTPTMRSKPAASETSGYVKPDSSYASKRSTSTYASRKSQNLYGKDSGFAPTPEEVESLGLTYKKSTYSMASTIGSPNNQPYWKPAYSTHSWRNKDGSVHTSLMDWDKRFLKDDLGIPRSTWSKVKSASSSVTSKASKASRAVSKTAKSMKSRLGTIFE